MGRGSKGSKKVQKRAQILNVRSKGFFSFWPKPKLAENANFLFGRNLSETKKEFLFRPKPKKYLLIYWNVFRKYLKNKVRRIATFLPWFMFQLAAEINSCFGQIQNWNRKMVYHFGKTEIRQKWPKVGRKPKLNLFQSYANK